MGYNERRERAVELANEALSRVMYRWRVTRYELIKVNEVKPFGFDLTYKMTRLGDLNYTTINISIGYNGGVILPSMDTLEAYTSREIRSVLEGVNFEL